MLSSILLVTDSDKEIKLSNTNKVHCTKEISTIDSFKMYSISDKLKVYKTSPLSLISESECKFKIDCILVIKDDIFCAGEGRLIKNMQDFILLPNIKSLIKMGDEIGIQTKDQLLVYDSDLNKVREFKSEVSYFLEGILLTANRNQFSIQKGNIVLDFFIEDNITCLTCDLLFTRIFCGTSSGKIYQINMDNKPNKILDYHQTPVKFIKMSVCNKYLYSVDEAGELLIWDGVVIDRVLMDNIRGIEIYI